MQNTFYIVEVEDSWYNLRLVNTHHCISCGGDLSILLDTLYKYVRKYKTPERVYKAVESTEYSTVSPATFEQREQEYRSGRSEPYEDLVYDRVAEALRDNIQDSPYNRAKKRVRTVLTAVTQKGAPVQESFLERKPVSKIKAMKIIRTAI